MSMPVLAYHLFEAFLPASKSDIKFKKQQHTDQVQVSYFHCVNQQTLFLKYVLHLWYSLMTISILRFQYFPSVAMAWEHKHIPWITLNHIMAECSISFQANIQA